MKQITTKNTVEMFSSIPEAIGVKNIRGVALGAVAGAGLLYAVSSAVPMTLTVLGFLIGLWLGNIVLYKSRWMYRPSLKALIFHGLKKKTMNSYDSLIANNLEFCLKGVNTYKGLRGELRVPIGVKYAENDPTVYLVINKGRIYYEEFVSVSALEMWDKALDNAFTTEEAASLPTHFSDKGYCRLQSFEEGVEKDWERHKSSKSTCMTERAELMQRRKDPYIREKIKLSCGCKDCTPTFLRCNACDKNADACNCLQTQKHGIVPLSITAA